jgi:hypothetical protein
MKKLKLILLVASCLIFVKCSTKQPAQMEGADKDPNGCKTSAGYRWSKIKKDCIRVFELPIQLENKEKTFSAGVVISEDKTQAEVMTKDGDFLLAKQSDDSYKTKDNLYCLKKVENKWTFEKNKEQNPEYTEVDK